MKKTYYQPTIEIITVDAQPILSGSENLGGSKGTYDASSQTQLSRDGGDWGDED